MTVPDQQDSSSTYTSQHIRKESGWGLTEYDEFNVPFQWIGRHATLTVQTISAPGILYIYAGSPDFSTLRTISVSASKIDQTQQISPGWKAYQFDISAGVQSANRVLEVTISIDKMLDIQEDPRDLGIMIREIQCRDRFYSGMESRVANAQRNIKRRVDYYSPSEAPGVLWLASFPRSGNTWMRFLLTNLLFERVRESRVVAEYIDEIIDPLFNLRQSNNWKIIAFESNSAHILKTHIPFSLSMPLKDKTIGAIYILRNPLDIVVSLCKRYPGQAEEILNNFLTYGTHTVSQQWNYGNWHSHVFSWLQLAKLSHSIPIILVKYEDLCANPFASCKRILNWLKIERKDDHIHQAIEQSSIDSLKIMESFEIKNETPGIFFTLEQKSAIKAGRLFLADGKSNSHRHYLTESEIQKGLATFGPLMKELGYI